MKSIKLDNINDSNIFSRQEMIIIRWLEANYFKFSNYKHKLTSFNELKDGVFFEAVIKNYAGQFSFVKEALKNININCNNDDEEKRKNLEQILNALKLLNL